MGFWFLRLLALLANFLRQRVSRASSLSLTAPEWAICRSCETALTDRVHRFEDASYCAACHEAVEIMTTDSEDECEISRLCRVSG